MSSTTLLCCAIEAKDRTISSPYLLPSCYFDTTVLTSVALPLSPQGAVALTVLQNPSMHLSAILLELHSMISFPFVDLSPYCSSTPRFIKGTLSVLGKRLRQAEASRL